jgi:N-acetylmuramoyl-L-alanine amidase
MLFFISNQLEEAANNSPHYRSAPCSAIAQQTLAGRSSSACPR